MKALIVMALLAAAPMQAADPLHFSSGPSRVALIELYTSEGCSSCPPADQWLGELKDKPGLWKEYVPVEFHVNYWDGLGWKDRLSSRAFTSREYAYASAWGSRSVYTPCFVRNGSEWRPLWGGPGAGAAGQSGLLSVDMTGDGSCRVLFTPEGAPDDRAAYTVHVALLGGGISSKVTAGENGGETLRHEFVVIGLEEKLLSAEAAGGPVGATVTIPKPAVTDTKRRALAAWVTRGDELVPLQATGGWLP
jgi:hypothetical protein